MKVLVTGADGMLGRDIVAAADAVHHEVVALNRDALDVTNERAVLRVFEQELPRVVVNCAAYTAVDLAQENEYEATRVNGEAAGFVSAAAAAIGAKVYYPSTDYVFDGLKGEPYVESDDVNPVGAYGRSKLAGEIATAEANPRHVIVRTSWLYGLDGRNFVDTMLTLAQQQSEVLVVRDQFGCPTYTRQLAEAIVEMFDFEKLGVMHIAGGDYCSWYDFAREIFRQSQLDVKVLSATTDMLDRPAPRPPFSARATERDDIPQLPRWDYGLHGYLAARARRAAEEAGVA
ncbi:MAG: dTDP-4-dehydrorhamnose reductase, partial [Actinobacteria bacterium]|nr:dTDP-4-dehydrorhamnose reductase [Actinomycetota bacterium]